jgi:hypothetical protein
MFMFTHPKAFSEASLRTKIERCRLAKIEGRTTHLVFKR